MPTPRNCPVPIVPVGARALEGAVARLSPHDNQIPLPAEEASTARLGWGQWPDWDNGHADGGYSGAIVCAAPGGDRAVVPSA